MGLGGWGYADVLPYFKRSESLEGGGDPWHGGEGPLKVSKASSPQSDLSSATIEAGGQAGYPLTKDFNGYPAGRLGPVPAHHPRRRALERGARPTCYPALGRSNLTTLTGARTTKIVIEGGRATGVEIITEAKGGRRRGAMPTPRCMLSRRRGAVAAHPATVGRRPIRDELTKHGVPVGA